MRKLVLFVIALLLPLTSATPAVTYANPAEVILAGFITPAFATAGDGIQEGTGPCNGVNVTVGTYTASGNSVANSAAFDIDCILSNSAAYDLRVGTSGSQPQNYFSYVRVVDCAGVTRTFTSASATYGTTGGRIWTWGTGSSVVLVAGCAATTAQMIFFR